MSLSLVPDGAADKESCNAQGAEVLADEREVFESPTSEIFVPQEKGTDICIFFPTPHKEGNTVELPPWKKGWHRPMAPQYAMPHFMRCRSPPTL